MCRLGGIVRECDAATGLVVGDELGCVVVLEAIAGVV